jgi:hypothetical protein
MDYQHLLYHAFEGLPLLMALLLATVISSIIHKDLGPHLPSVHEGALP